MKGMKAVITGDIAGSRMADPKKWQALLRDILGRYGNEPGDWELYRGDSFQLKCEPKKALYAAVHLKAGIKQSAKLDVRIAIGIGEEDHKAKRVTESTGSAFIRSGECFDQLKKQTLGISTGNQHTDQTLNLMFSLASLTMDSWTENTAYVIKTVLENPGKSQKELSEIIGKSQSSISQALNRGGFNEVMKMEAFYQTSVS